VPDRWDEIVDELVAAVEPLEFGPPVACVYDPLVYAREPCREYLERFARPPKEVLLVGMNPGPWGMSQTGVPFGEIAAVRDWMGIDGRVERPEPEHPKRPIEGFACSRSEVSGRRLWGWARERFGAPERFFERFLVCNYCPLVFLEEGGRNRTPDKLPRAEAEPLLAACDRALAAAVDHLRPRLVVGIGRFAEDRARRALGAGASGDAPGGLRLGCVLHPSPASPAANRGWAEAAEETLRGLGVEIP
jgi:single-strand selective monofunctional uracil DNA glycosylase